MDTSKISAALIAGLIGTAVMTAVMYIAPYMGFPEMDIINLLGTMFTTNATLAFVLGLVIHFMMGALFGLLYAFLWTKVGKPDFLWGLIFGAVHGVIATVMMPVISAIHPRADVAVTLLMAVGLIMGHIIFGIVVALTYRALYARSTADPLVHESI